MSAFIFNPFTTIPKSNTSHVRGWAMLWEQRLHDVTIADSSTDFTGARMLYLEHGVNHDGGLNLFGGVNDDVAARLTEMVELCELGTDLVYLDRPGHAPSYYKSLTGRLGNKSTSDLMTPDLLERFRIVEENAWRITHNDFSLDAVIFGDSHTGSFSLPHQKVIHNNGLTLHTILTRGLPELVEELGVRDVTICAGSIDIRFHVFTHNWSSTEYVDTFLEQAAKCDAKISICAPVPVEFEGRKIPKTGHYNGEPFYESSSRRAAYAARVIELLEQSEIDVVRPPMSWYHMDGETYAKQYMERGGSVHLAPTSYHSIHGWEE